MPATCQNHPPTLHKRRRNPQEEQKGGGSSLKKVYAITGANMRNNMVENKIFTNA
jgi:hypothetical protein